MKIVQRMLCKLFGAYSEIYLAIHVSLLQFSEPNWNTVTAWFFFFFFFIVTWEAYVYEAIFQLLRLLCYHGLFCVLIWLGKSPVVFASFTLDLFFF